MPLQKYTQNLIIRSFDMEADINLNDFEQILADRIDYLLANRLEFFFAAMYRMDVNENKIHQALQQTTPKPSVAVARLIIQRQLEKQASRAKYKSESDSFDDEW